MALEVYYCQECTKWTKPTFFLAGFHWAGLYYLFFFYKIIIIVGQLFSSPLLILFSLSKYFIEATSALSTSPRTFLMKYDFMYEAYHSVTIPSSRSVFRCFAEQQNLDRRRGRLVNRSGTFAVAGRLCRAAQGGWRQEARWERLVSLLASLVSPSRDMSEARSRVLRSTVYIRGTCRRYVLPTSASQIGDVCFRKPPPHGGHKQVGSAFLTDTVISVLSESLSVLWQVIVPLTLLMCSPLNSCFVT